jgi:hypothetical protein
VLINGQGGLLIFLDDIVGHALRHKLIDALDVLEQLLSRTLIHDLAAACEQGKAHVVDIVQVI